MSEYSLALTASDISRDIFGYRGILRFLSTLKVPVLKFDSLGPLERIGAGTYTTVYRSTLLTDGLHEVAVKEANDLLAHGDSEMAAEAASTVLSSVVQELRICAHPVLNKHPNIPNIIGVVLRDEGRDAVRPLVVMNLARGTLLQLAPSLPWKEVIRLCRDVSDGLVAMHAHKLTHGDVKADNSLVFETDGQLVATISDLGGSKPSGFPGDDIPGTLAFYAPECFRESPTHAAHVNDASRDAYSFAVMLVEVFLGRSPLSKIGSRSEQVAVQVDSPGTAIRLAVDSLHEHIPEECQAALEDLVRHCMAFSPRERPHMSEVSRTLSAILGEARVPVELPVEPLLENPQDPRIHVSRELASNSALATKLFTEYSLDAKTTSDPRIATYMAAFYLGTFGPLHSVPTHAAGLAATQWCLKAIELGSFNGPILLASATVSSILQAFGLENVVQARHESFQSPNIDLEKVRDSFQTFSPAPTGALSDALAQLQIPEHEQVLGPHSLEVKLARSRSFYSAGLGSDALDVVTGEDGSCLQPIFDDDVAHFDTVFEHEDAVTPGFLKLVMRAAIHGGSIQVVTHMLQQSHVRIDDYSYNVEETEDNGESTKQSLRTWTEEALLCNQPEVLDRLLRLRSDKEDLKALDSAMLANALTSAVLLNLPSLLRVVCQHLQARHLLKGLLELDDGEHVPSLYLVMEARAVECGTVLLEFGADPNLLLAGQPLTLWATSADNRVPVSFLEDLIRCGADLSKDFKGVTPLVMSVHTANLSATVILLIAGAKLESSEPEAFDAFGAARELVQLCSAADELDVRDEDGVELIDGPKLWATSIRLVLHALQIAQKKEEGWQANLNNLLQGAEAMRVQHQAWEIETDEDGRITVTNYKLSI